jgi:hypothetical protein
MKRSRYRLVPLIVLALIWIPTAAGAQDTAAQESAVEEPLGDELFTAKKILILNTVMDFSLSSAFTNELLDWERYEIVFSEEDADLCFALSAEDDYRQEEIPSGEEEQSEDDAMMSRRALGTMRTLDRLYLKVFVPGGEDLWRDEAAVGEDESAARLLVTRLRERMKEQEAAQEAG